MCDRSTVYRFVFCFVFSTPVCMQAARTFHQPQFARRACTTYVVTSLNGAATGTTLDYLAARAQACIGPKTRLREASTRTFHARVEVAVGWMMGGHVRRVRMSVGRLFANGRGSPLRLHRLSCRGRPAMASMERPIRAA